ncbi:MULTISPECIES: hypothetical protein [Halobacterium]|uniref:hypothetical protein n=1 Tax=Halobacterium TaxID=2239 RepID=UPI00073E813C|nr:MULTISPECIES: hypothetical protein [Halobacterium]MCG1002845.1 hypothetical protein [Halobacterium noricense]
MSDTDAAIERSTEPADYRAVVEDVLGRHFEDRTFNIEDGVVWVSGQNAHCRSVAEQMAHRLVQCDVPCGLVYDDEHAPYGGVQFNYGENA